MSGATTQGSAPEQTGDLPVSMPPAAVTDKAFATLQAEAALAGFTCTRTSIGKLVLGRFGGGWIFDTLAEAETWLANHKSFVVPRSDGTAIEGVQP